MKFRDRREKNEAAAKIAGLGGNECGKTESSVGSSQPAVLRILFGTGQVTPFCEKRNRREGITRRDATLWRKKVYDELSWAALCTPPTCDVWWNEVAENARGQVVMIGHRIADIVAVAPTLEHAIATAYENIKKLKCLSSYYRTDVGESLWPPGRGWVFKKDFCSPFR